MSTKSESGATVKGGKREFKNTVKYVLVTGGVMSGLGKGVIASSTGRLLRSFGLRVTAIKIDPYINIDAGTMSPFEHGEVFVLDDGGEADLDLGNYERFLDIKLTKDNNITTGKIYDRVIQKERKGEYLGKTVQVVPHICDEIQEWVLRVAHRSADDVVVPELVHPSRAATPPPSNDASKNRSDASKNSSDDPKNSSQNASSPNQSPSFSGSSGPLNAVHNLIHGNSNANPPDVCIIELGGTVGDIESMPFIEAMRQFQFKVGRNNMCILHVSLVPIVGGPNGEQKTKPTQQSARDLRALGLTPDFIMCRSSEVLHKETQEKISSFCHVDARCVIGVNDVSNIYRVPRLLYEQDMLNLLTERLGLADKIHNDETEFNKWCSIADTADALKSNRSVAASITDAKLHSKSQIFQDKPSLNKNASSGDDTSSKKEASKTSQSVSTSMTPETTQNNPSSSSQTISSPKKQVSDFAGTVTEIRADSNVSVPHSTAESDDETSKSSSNESSNEKKVENEEPRTIRIAMVGKYTDMPDAYLSVIRALQHASYYVGVGIKIDWVEASDLEPLDSHSSSSSTGRKHAIIQDPKLTSNTNVVSESEKQRLIKMGQQEQKEENQHVDSEHVQRAEKHELGWKLVKECDGILVPGGFGDRGVEGMILAAKFARESGKPFFGICLGMQIAVIEAARSLLGWNDANSAEFDPNTPHPVIIFMPEISRSHMGGTMRLGKRRTVFTSSASDSLAARLYKPFHLPMQLQSGQLKQGQEFKWIDERHRHRYEVNPSLVPQLETTGLHFVGQDESGERQEIIEIPDHPFFLTVQFHPEFLSRPNRPSPPFVGLLLAASGTLNQWLDAHPLESNE